MKEEGKLKVSGDEIIDLIDSDDEEPTIQQEGGVIRGLMNLVTLTKEDLETLQENRLVNDACIDALADVIQNSIDTNEVSICHTGFWAAAREHGWGDEAKKIIHPDPEDVDVERWQAYKFTRGNLKSKLLMIPCNFPGKSEVKVGHWILAIREKGENDKHKLHVLEQDSGRQHRNMIARQLINSPIFHNFPKGKTFNVEEQIECECGARVAKFMEDITRNYLNMNNRDTIANMTGRTIAMEKIKADGK